MKNVLARSIWLNAALFVVVMIAAGLRLYHLGVPSFRADTMIFFDFCHRPITAWAIFSQWLDLMGKSAQFPFPVAITKYFIDVLHLSPTAFMIRLPNALFGILTVLGMYMLGRQLAGRAFGLLLALWMAVNPFHIQLSREAYFYSSLLLGVTLQAWACLWAYRHRNRHDSFPVYFHVLTQMGFFLMIYSHFSGWCIGIFYVLFLGWILGRRAWRNPHGRKDFWWWLVLSGVIGIPLLFVSWGLPYFLRDALAPEEMERSRNLMGGLQTPLITFVWQALQSASWGQTPLRIALLVIVGGLTVIELVFNRNRCRRALIMVLLLFGGLLAYKFSFATVGSYYAQRHLAFLFPLYLSVMAYGAWHLSLLPLMHRVIVLPVWRRIFAYALAAIAVALSVQPAWLSTQLTGKPTPFKEVARWCDTRLPPRTLVLVERWLDPWNELRVHNSTNVFFAFTVPSEPEDMFKRFNWPATAKAFFENFPDAAYLEYNNSGRNLMGVVSNVYFAKSVAFTNMAGIKLAKMGVAYRDDFYDAHTNRLITTVFYNTREDIIRHAREQGKSTLVLYGPEWGYVKLWQELKDFRDWRILEKQAALDVYNLTASTNRVTLKMRGMALNGSKRIEVLGEYNGGPRPIRDFRHLQLEEWEIKDITLRPGLNKIVFSDSLWSVSKVPLLVDQVKAFPQDAAMSAGGQNP